MLGNFIYNDVNMLMIESRPIEGRSWEYRFFVDVEMCIRDSMEVAPFGPLKADRKSAAVIEPSFAVRNRILPMSFEEECLIAVSYTHLSGPENRAGGCPGRTEG